MLSLLDKTIRTAKWHGRPLPEVTKASVKESLNGDFVLTFTYPITDSKHHQALQEDFLVRCPVPVLGHQLFRIKKVVEGNHSIEVTAYHISEDVMTRLINPFFCEQQPCATALSSLVMASKTPLGDVSLTSDITNNRTYTADKEQTLYSALLDGKHSIVGTWEGELVRDNLALSVKSSRGQNRGVVISTHYNLKKYERTKESSKVITRIHASSTFKEEGQETETVLKVTVDSPLIGNYPFINEVTYTNNTLKTRQELEEWARAKFRLEGIDQPKDAITIEAYELDGQTVHLGDTVTLKSRLHGIDMTKKAVAYDFDPLTMTYRTLTFDDRAAVGKIRSSGGLSTLATSLIEGNKRSEDVAIELALESANRAFESAFEKRQTELETAIQQAESRGEVYADSIRTDITNTLSTLSKRMASHEADNARTTQEILAKAGANTQLATEAKTKAEQAQTGAREALEQAIVAKQEAIHEAERLSTSVLNQAESKVTSAKGQAIQEASRLIELAKRQVNEQVTNLTTDLSQTKESIKLLATKQSLDALTGRVTSAEASLRVTATDISQRVKQSEFNQATQRLTRAESHITQMGHRLTTELSETVAMIPREIGGRNLYLVKDQMSGYLQNNSLLLGPASHLRQELTSDFIGVNQGDHLSLQFWATVPGDGVEDLWHSWQFYDRSKQLLGGRQAYGYGDTAGAQYARHVIVVPPDAKYLRVSYRSYSDGRAKVEKSRLPSDWSLAPEDVEEGIASAKTLLSQTAEGQTQLSTRLSQAERKVVSAETQLRQLVNDVSSKVSQTTFDTMTRRVDQQETAMSQTQRAIALKADRTVTDHLSETIKKTNAALQVTSDTVKTKVSMTDFNAATNRLRTAESTIQNLSGQINTKLSQTEVNRLVDGKGFVTSTTMTNAITQSANGLTSRISQVEGKIPSVIGGRNLIRDYGTAFKNANSHSSGWRFEVLDDPSAKSGKVIKAICTKAGGVGFHKPIFDLRGHQWQGQTLTYAVDIKCSKAVRLSIKPEALSGSAHIVSVSTDWQRFVVTRPVAFVTYWSFVFYLQGGSWSVGDVLYIRDPKLEEGRIATSPDPAPEDLVTTTAFHEVRDTVAGHTRTIGDQASQISQVVQTASGLVTRVGSLETSRATTQSLTALQTQVSTLAGSWSVRNLTGSGSVLSQLNLTKNGTVKIDGKLVQITGTTYIQDGVIASSKIACLDAGKVTTGLLSASRIGTEAITADKMKVDQAFFNKLTANEAYLRQLFAKSAFITQVQAVALSASQISGGLLRATNGAMTINLSLGNIKFFTNSPSISREVSGYPHQWVSFETGTSNGKPCGVTVIGSNRWHNWSSNDGGFVGIRAWNGGTEDQIDIVGDTVRLASSPFQSSDGWDIITLPNRLSIDAHRGSDRPTSVLNIGDIKLFRTSSSYVSLKEVLHQFNHNFKHLVNITGRGDVILTWDTIK